MTVRSTMSDLITLVRNMIYDVNVTPQFTDQIIQDRLDSSRTDVRYEPLTIAPTIINIPSTGNIASVIYADYYSRWHWWESDVILQGNNTSTGAAWIVLNPLASDFIVGHFQFELTPFVNGTVPGQYPPVFAVGKIYDPYMASAQLLEFWAASLACNFDFSSDGQSFRKSQLMQNKLTLAQTYKRQAKGQIGKMVRSDVNRPIDAREVRLLDGGNDQLKGVW